MQKFDYPDAKLVSMMKSEKPEERREALTYIYNNYFQNIRSLVTRNSGSTTDAEDIFQEGVVILYENILLGKYKGRSSIMTYLYVICKNTWLKEIQKRRLPIVNIMELYNRGVDITEESGTELAPDCKQRINAALDKLDPDSKRLLIEFYYNNRSMKELKKIFNLGSEQAAKNKKLRSLKKLITILETSGLTKDHFFDENPGVPFFTGKV